MQIKEEINQIVNSLPEDSLHELLHYLKKIQNIPTRDIKLSNKLITILKEDRELLEKLAK